MTWPPRTIFAPALATLLVLRLIAATIVPWYRRYRCRQLADGSSWLVVIACVAFLVPIYWTEVEGD